LGALCKVKRAGLARHIGVSNFTVALVEEAVRLSTEPLICNQIEFHPFIDQSKVIAACAKNRMAIVAYCPLARGRVPGDPALAEIGKTHGKSAAQVALRWMVQQDIVVIPRTAKVEHLSSNAAIFDFKLSADEMARIAALANPRGRVVNFAFSPEWD
jgi:diketogulonate reductase-like aldo/keto reductase